MSIGDFWQDFFGENVPLSPMIIGFLIQHFFSKHFCLFIELNDIYETIIKLTMNMRARKF